MVTPAAFSACSVAASRAKYGFSNSGARTSFQLLSMLTSILFKGDKNLQFVFCGVKIRLFAVKMRKFEAL